MFWRELFEESIETIIEHFQGVRIPLNPIQSKPIQTNQIKLG
jgi:hypothetical protein